MNDDKYVTYTLEDFLQDDVFVRWAAAGDQDHPFWQSFTISYPSSAENFRQALSIIRSYRRQDFDGNEVNKDRVWNQITESIEQASPAVKTRIRWLRPWMRTAAAVLMIVVTGYLAVQRYMSRKQVIATDYGEKRTLTLPDNSVVILNANSSLHYAKWDTSAPREVWIKGEAFFDVTHINRDSGRIRPHERFLVHTDEITIEVLGTSYNVKNRRGKTNIGLVTGKIKVDYAGSSARKKAIVMLPGDYIEYGGDSLLRNQKLIRPEKLKDWTKPEIVFTDASMAEIIETLQDNYGYTVSVNNEKLKGLKIAGEINVANVDELLTVISTTLNIRVDKPSEKHLLFYLDR
jgi:transmembrane sensor